MEIKPGDVVNFGLPNVKLTLLLVAIILFFKRNNIIMALKKDSFQTLFVIQSTKKRLYKSVEKNLTKVLNKLKNCFFNRCFNLLQILSNKIFIPFNRFYG